MILGTAFDREGLDSLLSQLTFLVHHLAVRLVD